MLKPMRKKMVSLKYKLLIPIISALLVVFVLMHLIINNVTRSNSIRRTKELSLSQARVIASETDAYFNEARNIAYTLAQSFITQRNSPSKSRQLVLNTMHKVLSIKKKYYAIFTMWEENAFDNKDLEYGKMYGQKTGRFSASVYRLGDSIACYNNNALFSNIPAYLSDGGFDEFEEEYYLLPKTRQRPLITGPYLYSYTKNKKDVVNFISVVYPMIYEKSFLGIVGIDIDIDFLNSVIIKKPLSSNMYYSIISAEGIVIANPDSTIIGKKIVTKHSISVIQDSLKNVDHLVSEYYSNYHKSDMVQYFLPITIAGAHKPWLVMVEIPKYEIFTDARQLSFMVTTISFFSLLLLIIIIYLFLNSILQPIEAVVKFSEKLAGGELKARIKISRNDELGKLIETLHFMAEELNKHRNHLELLVQERTQETNQLNEELQGSNEELYTTNEILLEERNRLEDTLEELKQIQNQLVKQEKMASIGSLTAGIAHEINNPINFISSGITGLSFIIEEMTEITNHFIGGFDISSDCSVNKKINAPLIKEKMTEMLEEFHILMGSIKNGVDRTTNIVKGLRTFSRLDNENSIQTDLHQILDSTLTILHSKYKNRIEIKKNYNNIPDLDCYPGKLGQAFLNILVNAIQAIENEGEIKIKTELTENRDSVVITIIDNGSGIPQEIVNKIFDPFYTTKEVGEGTGLGLSIVHGIIEEHNGLIAVNTELNKGTEFIVNLPLKKNAEN